MSEKEQTERLLAAAWRVREHAYAPYVPVRVGAALLTCSGRIFTGANVQNAALSAGICAERVALFAAISAGERDFAALAVVSDRPVTPCGVCRQTLAEFHPDLPLILAWDGGLETTNLGRLLPRPFHLDEPYDRPTPAVAGADRNS
ncbi:MAG: cytidine deaminase [Proteobacteria bacterium]|nr:cytidine deaminase [Pseudomonadota bacterium]MBU1740424.1 cytidine deaminase [Pseudomonadota bacterium]